MSFDFRSWVDNLLINVLNMNANTVYISRTIILFSLLIVLCLFVWWLSKKIFNYTIPKVTSKTKTLWDDIIFNKKVINAVSRLLPAILFNYYTPIIFADFSFIVPFLTGITSVFIILVAVEIFSSLLNSATEILSNIERFKDKPLYSFSQLAKIIVYSIATILIISILINKNPLFLLSGIGAMAAIILLIFKDSILGFVASIQLSGNNMVRVGDWVTVEKYGADGDVIEINLTTIKVQNFDKTITTIPTYAFISDSFTNWRGMEESGGRRIKRAINIKIDSIQFCSNEMLERYKKYHLISNYIQKKQKEIDDYNSKNSIDKVELINGRHLTNIGVFRAYIEEYLKHNPNVNTEMTCMVRQLPPTEYGVPIEIYAFSKNKDWTKYEAIMADIFDHLFAATKNFNLKIFERPSTGDFK
ncbi:mechanosensitive ion channel family protein [Lutibacter sp.]